MQELHNFWLFLNLIMQNVGYLIFEKLTNFDNILQMPLLPVV